MGLFGRLAHAYNAFTNRDPLDRPGSLTPAYGSAYSSIPGKPQYSSSNERSTISAIYTRIAIDVSSTEIRHVRLDDNGRYLEDIDSGLNNCFTIEANVDQAPSAFWQDVVTTMFDKGVCAIVPVKTSINPAVSASFNILELRVGEIVNWFPRHVRVNLYNDETGRNEELMVSKDKCTILYNPLYDVMNRGNSTLQRLVRKINLLDMTDEKNSSGKLDMIIQLPYVIKSEARREQAQNRRQEIETQLTGSKYGIAYTDGTEKITQLNRPVENNLFEQVKTLREQLYAELGITAEVMNGTADEAAMLNYQNRTIEPILRTIVEGMRRTFLTKTARSQKQWILYFTDPFKLVPVAQLAEIADKMTRNKILTSNEFRGILRFKPAKDPGADKLENSNMPAPSESTATPAPTTQEGDSQNDSS